MLTDTSSIAPDADVMPLVCDVGVRAVAALRKAGVIPADHDAVTPAQIASVGEGALLKLPNVGRTTVKGLRAILRRAGLDFTSRRPATAARPPLTPRQQVVYGFVARHIREHSYAPTLREICAATGIRGLNGVYDHLSAIVRKGWLRRDAEKARGLVLVEEPAAAERRCVIALDEATAARCAVLLHELLDGPLGDDLALGAEHDRDLRALLEALDVGLRNSTISRAAGAAHAHGGT